LRGTNAPEEAFPRLDGSDSEYGRTTRWETVEAAPGRWRGRVHIAHDPALEEDGLLAMHRAAELRAIPALFGFARVHVVAHGATSDAASSLAQDFEVTWSVPRVSRTALFGAAVGAVALAIPAILHPSFGTTMALAATSAVGALLGAAWARDRTRRAETQAQVA